MLAHPKRLVTALTGNTNSLDHSLLGAVFLVLWIIICHMEIQTFHEKYVTFIRIRIYYMNNPHIPWKICHIHLFYLTNSSSPHEAFTYKSYTNSHHFRTGNMKNWVQKHDLYPSCVPGGTPHPPRASDQ